MRLILPFILFATIGWSQESENRFNFYAEHASGLNLATIMAKFYSDKSPRLDYRGQFNFGVSALNNKLSVQIGLNYIGRGFRSKLNLTDIYGNTIETVIVPHRFGYLGIPVMVGTNFGGENSLFVNLGVVTSFLLYARYDLSNLSYPGLTKIDNSDTYRNVDLIATAEFGYRRAFDKFFLKAFLGFDFGLLNAVPTATSKDFYQRHYGPSLNIGIGKAF